MYLIDNLTTDEQCSPEDAQPIIQYFNLKPLTG